MIRPFLLLTGLTIVLLSASGTFSQESENVAQIVRELKSDSRGPFERIVWVCPDGTVLPASENCPQPGGFQRGLLKEVVTNLENRGIYIGQLLAGQDREAFLDRANDFSRSRQYLLQKYLESVDNGWVMRHARTYRGAIQADAEEGWGRGFLEWLLADDRFAGEDFFFARELVRAVPHTPDPVLADSIRTLAAHLANGMPGFNPISDKIHAYPDSSDITAIRKFRGERAGQLPGEAVTILQELEAVLEDTYAPVTQANLGRYLVGIPPGAREQTSVQTIMMMPRGDSAVDGVCRALVSLLQDIHDDVLASRNSAHRVALMDLSLASEQLVIELSTKWKPETPRELFGRIAVLCRGAAAVGFMDEGIRKMAEVDLDLPKTKTQIDFAGAESAADAAIGVIDASAATIRRTYGDAIATYLEFEPLTDDFYDDRVERSVLYPLGKSAGELRQLTADRFSTAEGDSTSHMRGLNAGVAVGELVVVHGHVKSFPFESDKIYVLQNAPASLTRVAGLLSVSAGNPVSHAQLLSRNLGIPNAAIATEDMRELTDLSGRLIFLAVSPGGSVVVKSTWDLTEEEKALVSTPEMDPEKVMRYLRGLDPEIVSDVEIALDDELSRPSAK